MRTIDWDNNRNCIVMIDQTRLPSEYRQISITTVDGLITAIRELKVRGAPALGAAGAYGVALSAYQNNQKSFDEYKRAVESDAQAIANARPTAVNLEREVNQVLRKIQSLENKDAIRQQAKDTAQSIADQDVKRNKRIGEHGCTLLDDGDTVLTHCNAGALATVDWGTALGIVYSAKQRRINLDVIATETRPLNQGARITTTELQQREINTKLIPDSAVGHFMQQGEIDAVIVGADRIVLDGGEAFDGQAVVFNKIGTYPIAVLANQHNIPVIVAAPTSTVDTEQTAGDVEIEQRDPDEIRRCHGEQNAPEEISVGNPAFDATPAKLVDWIVTESGRYKPPLEMDIN